VNKTKKNQQFKAPNFKQCAVNDSRFYTTTTVQSAVNY